MKTFVLYIRVSTKKQGISGLGLEAQRERCIEYINSQKGTILAEFKDVETGTSRTRQGLFDALDFCKKNDCTLVMAKLDRLARDVEFTFKVINTGVNIYFCDMPQVNTMILGVFASVAQYERELISERTKAGLSVRSKQLKENGFFVSKDGNICTKLGREHGFPVQASRASAEKSKKKAKENPTNVFFHNYILSFEQRNGKVTVNSPKEVFQQIADELNGLGMKTAKGLDYTSLRVRALWNKMKIRYMED